MAASLSKAILFRFGRTIVRSSQRLLPTRCCPSVMNRMNSTFNFHEHTGRKAIFAKKGQPGRYFRYLGHSDKGLAMERLSETERRPLISQQG